MARKMHAVKLKSFSVWCLKFCFHFHLLGNNHYVLNNVIVFEQSINMFRSPVIYYEIMAEILGARAGRGLNKVPSRSPAPIPLKCTIYVEISWLIVLRV